MSEHEQIDIESALEDAIFELTEVEDIRNQADMRRKVADVIEECLRPALAAAKANEKRVKALLDSLEAALTAGTNRGATIGEKQDLGAQLFDTACAINRVATAEARRDPGVIPVLRKLDCKVAQLTAPELIWSIKPEVLP